MNRSIEGVLSSADISVQGRDDLRRLNDYDYNDDDDDDDDLSNWRDLYHSSPATATAKRGLDICLSIVVYY